MKICDLHVAPRSLEDAHGIASLLAGMGVRCVAIDNPNPREARAYTKPFIEAGLEAYTRVTIEADSWGKALKALRRISPHYDLVAVKPKSAEVARHAAKDPRVALVQLPPGMARYMDRSQARLLREGGAGVEVSLLPLLHSDDPRRSLRGIMIIARRAAAYEAMLVITSGARSKWELWSPAAIRALLVSFGVPENIASLSVTGYPSSILYSKRLRG